MLKQTVTYEDFEGRTRTKDLYFNVSRTELAGRLDLKAELERLAAMLDGPERTLDVTEIRVVIDLVNTWMRLAYGIKSEDGERFRKSDEIWEDFVSSAAYEAFTWSLFTDPQKMMDFLTGVVPKELRDKAMSEMPVVQGITPPPIPQPAEKSPLGLTTEQLQAELERRQADNA